MQNNKFLRNSDSFSKNIEKVLKKDLFLQKKI